MIEIMLHLPKSSPVLLSKLICIHDKFSKPVLLYRGKNTVNILIESILKEYDYYKNRIKKLFDKNFVMSVEDKERFQLIN